MNSQQFDNHIKEQFSQYAPVVDPRLWEQIAARTKKKKPVGFWYSLLHFSLLREYIRDQSCLPLQE